jgi:hypothetical protein
VADRVWSRRMSFVIWSVAPWPRSGYSFKWLTKGKLLFGETLQLTPNETCGGNSETTKFTSVAISDLFIYLSISIYNIIYVYIYIFYLFPSYQALSTIKDHLDILYVSTPLAMELAHELRHPVPSDARIRLHWVVRLWTAAVAKEFLDIASWSNLEYNSHDFPCSCEKELVCETAVS